MRPRTIVMRASLAALLATAPVLVLAGPAAAAIGNPDGYPVAEDTQLVGNVLDNDQDEGFGLTAVLISGPSNGSLTLSPDGNFVYQPAANFSGTDVFSYMADDILGPYPAVTVTITVSPVDDPIVLTPDAYATAGGTQLVVPAPGILANDVSVDGPLVVANVSTAQNGVVNQWASDGSFTYTPNPGFQGVDNIAYIVEDSSGVPRFSSVSITVSNSAPVAAPDSYGLDEDTTLTAASVLSNDTDANGDALSAVLVSGPSNGALALATGGTFTYTPAADFNGVDSFTYEASDGTSTSAPATVTITVNPVVDGPMMVNPDTYSTPIGTQLVVSAPGVLANDTNPDGPPLVVGATSYPMFGDLVWNPDGSFVYEPLPGFQGVDRFLYSANDGSNGMVTDVTITIGNVAPIAEPDAYFLSEDTTLTATSVLSNDTDANGDALSAALVSGPSNGTLALAPDGTFTYTPVADFSGADSFTYQASDGISQSGPATVTLTVDAVADRPVFAVPILAVTAVEDTTYTGQTTATSADGLPLTYTAETTGTPTGSVVMNAVTGDFTFTPEPDFVGLAQLDVLACDTFGQCATQLVNITVTNTNDAPVATDQTVSVSRGTPVPQMFDVRDIDSQVLTFTVTTAAQRGTVVIDADMWTFVYTPTAGTSGPDSFVVEICDADGLCDSATVTLDVAAAPPVTVTPVAAPVDAAAPVGPAAAGTPGSDALPVTGADVTSLALGALGMIGLGSVLVARGSRRVVRG